MIKISEEIKKLYIEDSTPIELEVRFKDDAFPTIKGSDVLSEQMTLHESICEEEQLKFGGCNASSFELTVFNLNSGIKGYEIEPVLITNKTEIPLGVFYVETIEKYAGKDYKKLTAYDKMRYFDVDVKDWYDNLTFPISVKNFRDSLCEYVGVEQNEVTLIADNIMLTKELDSSNGINGLSLMKQICEISGVFGRMDRYGKFDYLSLESSMLLPADDLYPANDLYPSAGSGDSENSFNISTSLMYEHPLVEDFFTSNIDGVIIVDSEGAEYITENKGNPYYIQDNFAIIGQSYDTITQLAVGLAKKISNISYRPVNSSKVKGQPYVECGDFISGEVNGYGFEAYVFQRDLTGIKALRDAYICKGKELLENDMNGVTATLQRLNNSIGKTKVIIEKTEKGLRGEISQSLEESKKYTDESSSATLESANNYAQDAAQGALNAANNNTNEKLKSYYTKEENDNQFDATARGFTAQISSTKEELKKYTDSSASSTLDSANEYAQEAANGALNAANNNTNEKLKSYYTKTEADTKLEATANGFSAEITSTQKVLKEYADNAASSAQSEAISSANASTDKKLKNYYTKEENNNQFDATAQGFTAQILSTKEELKKYTDSSASSTLDSANNYAQEAAQGAMNAANNNTNEKLKSYYTKEESDLQIKASSDSLSSTISKTQSKWDLVSSDGKKDYRNKKVNYGFGKTTNGSELFVDSDGKYYYLDVSSGIMYQIIKLGGSGEDTQYGIEEQTQLRTIESHTSSEISQISNEIVLKVDADGKIVKVSLRGSETGTEFKVNADNIKLSASDVINLISNEEINLNSTNISIVSDNFTVNKDGVKILGDLVSIGAIKVSDGTIQSKIGYGNGGYKKVIFFWNPDDSSVWTMEEQKIGSQTFTIEPDSKITIILGDAFCEGDFNSKNLYASNDIGGKNVVAENIYGNTANFSSSPIVSSDKYIKKDIQSLDKKQSSDFIYALNPVEYKYINGTSGRLHHGFIAQEIHDSMQSDWGVYCDEKIETGEKCGKAIRYEELIADLIATVQLQNERIKVLESQIGGR